MPVHQIAVAPARDAKSSPRSKDKHEGAKTPGHSGGPPSSISKASGSAAGSGTVSKMSATPSAPQDTCSSGPLARLEESACATSKPSGSKHPRPVAMTTASQSTQKKKAVRRRHRRRKDVCGALGCVDAPAEGQGDRGGEEGSPSPHHRRERQRGDRREEQPPRARWERPAPRPRRPPSDTTSEDEGGWRKARSWSKEKARRGRRDRDRGTGTGVRSGGDKAAAPLELQSMCSDDDEGAGEKTQSLPEYEALPEKRRSSGGSVKSEGGGGSQGGRGFAGSPSPGGGGSSLAEEEVQMITKRHQEKGTGGGDMAVPTATKHCGVNGETAQPIFSDDSDTEVCRICHCEGEEEYPLITPCWCTGSLRFVHQACLNQWIKASDTRCCELCKYDFIMETRLKPLRKWERLHMTKSEWRKILCSVVFHLLAIACVAWSIYVLLKRTTEEFRLGKEDELWRMALMKYYTAEGVIEWPFWTKLTVVGMGLTSGLVFMYIQCAVYLQLWRRLKAFNRIITVQNCPEKGLHPPWDPKHRAKVKRDAVEVPVEVPMEVPVEVPVRPAPTPVPEEEQQQQQTDSDLSVEAAVAPV